MQQSLFSKTASDTGHSVATTPSGRQPASSRRRPAREWRTDGRPGPCPSRYPACARAATPPRHRFLRDRLLQAAPRPEPAGRQWRPKGCSRCRANGGSRPAGVRTAQPLSRRPDMSTASSPTPWPPLISTAWQPVAPSSALAWATISSSLRACWLPSRIAASGRLGVIRVASGKQVALDGLDGLRRQQHVAARRHHHRIDDQWTRGRGSQHAATTVHDFGVGQHSGLDGADVQVGQDRAQSAPRRTPPKRFRCPARRACSAPSAR